MPGLRYRMWLYLLHIFLEDSSRSTAWPIRSIRHWDDCSAPVVDVWQEFWVNLWPLAVASQESRPLRRLLAASPLPRSGRGRDTVTDPDISTHTCQCEAKERNKTKQNKNVHSKYQVVFRVQILYQCCARWLYSDRTWSWSGVLSKDEVWTEEVLLCMFALLNNVVLSLHWNCWLWQEAPGSLEVSPMIDGTGAEQATTQAS